MLAFSIAFFVLALIAAIFGYGGLSEDLIDIGKILFFIFLVLFVISLLVSLFSRRRV